MVVTTNNTQQKKIPYPKSVFFIISNEFCERFSFYGMRTILSLYLRNVLQYSESSAKVLYHSFTVFVYFFPIFGAILSDSWLGKFRTIMYLSCIYAIGNAVLSLAAITPLHLPQVEISVLGLMLIAVGTGGIKPCVSAFGGDQFVVPQQQRYLVKFFSMFYFAINAGSLISTMLTPILREDVHCFGDDSCYSLAFGVPGILMIVSIILFISGKPLYKTVKPTGNMLVKVSKCIGHAVVQKVKNKSNNKRDHWLDYSADKYDAQLIKDIKVIIGILILYIPIPFFWTLFDQQGTGWTFQASRMNGDIGFYMILPDQMQVVNPVLILVFIPLFDSCIYPLLAKCHILKRPLQRLVVGGLLAAVAFAISAIVEQQLQKTYPVIPKAGEAQLRIYNGMPCEVIISERNQTTLTPLDYRFEKFNFNGNYIDHTYTIKPGKDCPTNAPQQLPIRIHSKDMIALFVRMNSSNTFEIIKIKDNVEKSNDGLPLVRTMVGSSTNKLLNVVYKGGFKDIKTNTSKSGIESLVPLPPSIYDLYVNDTKLNNIKFEFKLGGVYSVVVDYDQKIARQYTISEPNSLHILWCIPQIVVITMAEIMFSITGLEFSYSQAPVSMKSVMQAGWLLTTAFGNLIVVIIEEMKIFENQVYQYLLYAALMVIDMGIFALLTLRYKYVKVDSHSEEETDIDLPMENHYTNNKKQQGKDNPGFESDHL